MNILEALANGKSLMNIVNLFSKLILHHSSINDFDLFFFLEDSSDEDEIEEPDGPSLAIDFYINQGAKRANKQDNLLSKRLKVLFIRLPLDLRRIEPILLVVGYILEANIYHSIQLYRCLYSINIFMLIANKMDHTPLHASRHFLNTCACGNKIEFHLRFLKGNTNCYCFKHPK